MYIISVWQSNNNFVEKQKFSIEKKSEKGKDCGQSESFDSGRGSKQNLGSGEGREKEQSLISSKNGGKNKKQSLGSSESSDKEQSLSSGEGSDKEQSVSSGEGEKDKNDATVKQSKKKKFLKYFSLFGVGTVAGFVNGFFGAGGGLLLVPMITFVGKVKSKTAHATTLMCVLFMCIASSIMYFIKREIDYKLVLLCTIGGLVGSLAGTKLLQKLKNNFIDLIFSFILVAAGVLMIIF